MKISYPSLQKPGNLVYCRIGNTPPVLLSYKLFSRPALQGVSIAELLERARTA